MQMELKAFLGSSGKGFLLSIGIIREFNGFVDRWEMNKGREKTNPMESTGKDVFLVNILVDIISNESIFSWLNTFNCYGDIHDNTNETEAKCETSASFTGAHSTEGISTIFKTIFHL